jgi:hypothetical protein
MDRYRTLLPQLRLAACQCGYTLGVHGSIELDLIAVPWVEEVLSPEDLIQALCRAAGGQVAPGAWPETKPQGRLRWAFKWGEGYITIHVFPGKPSALHALAVDSSLACESLAKPANVN